MRAFALIGSMAGLLVAGCGSKEVGLPTDPVERAATCAVVAAADAREKTGTIQGPLPLPAQSKVIHYAMLTGAEGPQFSADRAQQVVKLMPKIGGQMTAESWKPLVGPCDQAFPVTVAAGPIALPKDPLDAELACDGVAGFVSRAVQTASDAAAKEELVRYQDMRAKLDTRIGVQLKRRGETSFEAIQAARQKALAAAARLGPPARVMETCLGRFGDNKG